jgi:hypothetical protein
MAVAIIGFFIGMITFTACSRNLREVEYEPETTSIETPSVYASNMVYRTALLDFNKVELENVSTDPSLILPQDDDLSEVLPQDDPIEDPNTLPADDVVTVTTEAAEAVIEEEEVPIEETPEPTQAELLAECLGNSTIEMSGSTLTKLSLPSEYYPGIDFSTVQPYENYTCITNKSSAAYKITRSDNAYTDENGLRRYKTNDGQFTVNGQDDYVIALGTYYKAKGVCGTRYLIVTSTGMYTAITGDEKSDLHTDTYHMFSYHGSNNQYAGMIEWIVDSSKLPKAVRSSGSMYNAPIENISGEILMIYAID